MKHFLITISFVACSVFAFAEIPLSKADLRLLDETLKHSHIYEKIKVDRIDSVKNVFVSAESIKDKIDNALRLGREYESFIADSSYVYYDEAYRLATSIGDSISMFSARIARFKALAVSGLYNEAVDELTVIETAGVPDTLLVDFYDSARQLYYYMMGYAQSNGLYLSQYFTKNRLYRDKLIERMDINDPLYKLYYAEMLQDQGKIMMSRDELLILSADLPDDSPLYARVMSVLATLATIEGDYKEAAHYHAVSAISDIKCAIKENVSMQNLAQYLYSIGDIERAYRYISVAMNDANFCNARLRNMQIARTLPLINGAYKTQIDTQKMWLLILNCVIALLAVGFIVAIVMIWKRVKKLRVARQSLKHANSVKDEYMGRFLDLCSIYMERLDNFNKLVMRKVTAGQIDDLLKMTKSAKFAEEQNKLFYENFDSAFLHIYPTFVEEFNKLLIPEERIEVKNIGHLTIELRIFAFLRMGIDDSTKIASFLRYSVNTIYTYRNKTRNKAINRETFDSDVMKIGTIIDEN